MQRALMENSSTLGRQLSENKALWNGVRQIRDNRGTVRFNSIGNAEEGQFRSEKWS